MRILLCISLLISALSARRHDSDHDYVDSAKQSGPTDIEKQLWAAIAQFGHLVLTQVLRDSKSTEGVLVSPFSVHAALSMVVLGAEGQTKDQMRQIMRISAISDDDFKQAYSDLISRQDDSRDKFVIRLASRLYAQEDLRMSTSYSDLVKKTFHSDALNVNFAVNGEDIKNQVNAFVDNRTNHFIPEILTEPLSETTVMLIVNALYFRGNWTKQMRAVKAPAMFNKHCGILQKRHNEWLKAKIVAPYLVSTSLDATLLRLPYGSPEHYSTSMLIIIPSKAHSCNIQKWVQRIKWDSIERELKKMKRRSIDLTMPRFELAYHAKLNNVLTALGMDLPFSPTEADLSGILSNPTNQIHIDQLIHHTKMIVNQFGTEAVGSTVIKIVPTSLLPREEITLKIDRSFYVAILYEHKKSASFLPLFNGVVPTV